MNSHYRRILTSLHMGMMTLAVYGLLAGELRAGFTFLGPTPYLSAADSPFAEHIGKANFYLEDFEDGELNTPGIGQPAHPVFGTAFQGAVMPPGDFTDSVDADDGVIDGDGRSGHAFRSGVDFIIDTLPPIHTFQLTFEFDSAVLGYLPNSFGVTWTDGPPESSFSLLLTTGIGETVSSEVIRRVGDTSRNGETAEDFFLGVIAPSGIAEITVRGSFVGELQDSAYIEIDHLQYGRIVPEPATTVLMCWVSYAACSSRLRRAR